MITVAGALCGHHSHTVAMEPESARSQMTMYSLNRKVKRNHVPSTNSIAVCVCVCFVAVKVVHRQQEDGRCTGQDDKCYAYMYVI